MGLRFDVIRLAHLIFVSQADNLRFTLLADIAQIVIQHFYPVIALPVEGKIALKANGFAATVAEVGLRLRAAVLISAIILDFHC